MQQDQIKLKVGDTVQVACPSRRKYPRFYDAFHGRVGRVFRDWRPSADSVEVNLSAKGESEFISVHPDWLSHADAKSAQG